MQLSLPGFDSQEASISGSHGTGVLLAKAGPQGKLQVDRTEEAPWAFPRRVPLVYLIFIEEQF